MVFSETMRSVGVYFVCFLVLNLFVPGCSKAGGDRPPVIRYAKDRCTQCGMIISEELFASALVKTNGETAKFDDVGCMIRFRARLNPKEERSVLVHDYESGAWIEAQTAKLVHAREIVSPMGYSLAAFSNASSAEKWAGKWNGEITDLDHCQIQSSVTE